MIRASENLICLIRNTEHVSLSITHKAVTMEPVLKAAKLLKALARLSSSSLAYPQHTSQSLNGQLTSLGSQIPPPPLLSTFGHTG